MSGTVLRRNSLKGIFRSSSSPNLTNKSIPSGMPNEMHSCVQIGDSKGLKKILASKKAKSLLSETNDMALTPLLLAFKLDNAEMIEMFLQFYEKHKVDINQEDEGGYTLLHTAVTVASDTGLLRLLKYDGLKVDVENKDKTTPLHYFCQKFTFPNCQEPFDALVKKGANVNASNNHGETPLHKAIFNPSVRLLMVEMLLLKQADVNARTNRGDTALHFAVNLGREDLVALLLRNEADFTIREQKGKTALDVAVDLDNKSIQKRLRNVIEKTELEGHKNLFLREEMYKDVLVDVTDPLLEKLGITTSGKRLKILKATASLRAELLLSGNQKGDSSSLQELGKISGLCNDWLLKKEEVEFTLRIGSGGAGKVYKGIYRGVEVAIKVLKEAAEERLLQDFKKEVEIMSSLRAPEIVQFFGICFNSKMCMVMEYCQRGSLFHVINDAEVTIDWAKVFQFASEMTKGMGLLHSHDIVHRDIKSLNLLVTGDWHVKVCDFGLSRFDNVDNLETLGKLRGTPAYCSPEVIMGKKFSAKSDIYGMGIVLWELVNRCVKGRYERPFGEFPDLVYDFQIMMQSAQQGTRPTIPDFTPKKMEDFLNSIWVNSPEDRPSCDQMLETLESLKGEFEANSGMWMSLHSVAQGHKMCDSPNTSEHSALLSTPHNVF